MEQHVRLVPSVGAGEAQLIEGGQDFETFYVRHRQRLFVALCLVTGSRPEAEEVMQDAFLKVYERWDRVSEMQDPTGYLFRTAMNVFRSRARRAAMALRRTLSLAPPANDLATVEDRDAIVRALQGLTAQQRAAIVLTALLDYSAEDAGRMLGIRAATVRTLASRARAAMKDRLEELR